MIYTVRYAACVTCKHKYSFRDEPPCSECCHGKEDKYESEAKKETENE